MPVPPRPPALTVTATDTGSRFTVRVLPRARRVGVDGLRRDALVCRVAAAPVDGAANDAAIRLLADWMGVPRRYVRIISGERTREKVIEVDGVEPAGVLARVASALGP